MSSCQLHFKKPKAEKAIPIFMRLKVENKLIRECSKMARRSKVQQAIGDVQAACRKDDVALGLPRKNERIEFAARLRKMKTQALQQRKQQQQQQQQQPPKKIEPK